MTEPSNELDHLDKMAEQHSKDPMVAKVNQQIVSLLPPIPPNAHVLDFGCGAGRISLLLAKMDSVESVVGTDSSEKMIETAHQLLKEDPNPKVSFQTTDRMPDLKSWNDSTDLVVMSLVLGHISPREAGESVLARVVSTLKKGGTFALAEFLFVEGEEQGGGHHHHDHSHEHSHSHSHDHSGDEGKDKSHHGGHVAYTEEEIRTLFTKVGLEPAKEFTPFEFDWGGVSRKCVMAVGTKV